MSILEGLIAADKNKSVKEEAALRKMAAERQNEEFGWRRAEQERAATDRQRFEDERGMGLSIYENQPQSNPFLDRLGLTPPRAQMQPPVAEMPQGMGGGQPVAPMPQAAEGGQPVAPMPQGGLQQPGFTRDPRWQALQQQMRLARTPEQLAAVHQSAQQFQQAQQRSGLYDAVLNATPDQMVQFSQKFSDFSPVRGKTEFDPKTGLTRLTLDNGKPVMLNRAQMAQMVEGMHRMSQGDATGIQVLAGVNKDLAASAKEDFDRLVSVTNSGNDVAYKGNAMNNDNARTRIAAQGLKLRQDAANATQAQYDAADAFGKRVDGVLEGYQAAIGSGNKEAAAIYAREYDQLRAQASNVKGLKVPPNLQTLAQQRSAGASDKPVKVADEGERYLVDGRLKLTDGRGGYISERGVLPSMQDAALKEAGVPDNLRSQLRFTPDGTEVVTPGGVAYGLDEIPQMIADMRRLAVNSARVDELQRRGGWQQTPYSMGTPQGAIESESQRLMGQGLAIDPNRFK